MLSGIKRVGFIRHRAKVAVLSSGVFTYDRVTPDALCLYSPDLPKQTEDEAYTVTASIWLEKDGELFIDGRRALLLENIERYGSIKSAALETKVAYANAWLWVEAMNRLALSPLVKKFIGGAGGSSSRLTDEGRKVLAHYRKLCSKLEEVTINC